MESIEADDPWGGNLSFTQLLANVGASSSQQLVRVDNTWECLCLRRLRISKTDNTSSVSVDLHGESHAVIPDEDPRRGDLTELCGQDINSAPSEDDRFCFLSDDESDDDCDLIKLMPGDEGELYDYDYVPADNHVDEIENPEVLPSVDAELVPTTTWKKRRFTAPCPDKIFPFLYSPSVGPCRQKIIAHSRFHNDLPGCNGKQLGELFESQCVVFKGGEEPNALNNVEIEISGLPGQFPKNNTLAGGGEGEEDMVDDSVPAGESSTAGKVTELAIISYACPEPLAVLPPLKVKYAGYNSDYIDSPFALGMVLPVADRKTSRSLQRVLETRIYDSSLWYDSKLKWATKLTGSDLAEQIKLGGEMLVGAVDAVIQSHSELDAQMYGAGRKHWKGYLPTSFSDIVFGSNGDEYLYDDRVRDMFIGDHLYYDFEHCRKIVAPVNVNHGYSCYIWDLSAMDCHVLDPVRMTQSEKMAEGQHNYAMKFLTAALVKCVKTFFKGWRLPEGDWLMSVSTDFGPRCRAVNSAVHVLHYARWYNVICLEKKIKESGLGDIRAGMLMQIVSSCWNVAPFRSSLMTPALISRGPSFEGW